MGQEASVPMDGRSVVEEELEEQARAPPSTVNPAPVPPPSHKEHHNKGRKLINGIMKRSAKGDKGGGGDLSGGNNSNYHGHDHESFEYREAARAAAAGGNLYLRDNATSEDYALQKMPSQQPGEPIGPTFYQPAVRNDEIAKAEEARKPPTLEAVAAALGRAPPSFAASQQEHPPIPNSSSGNKKGLFTTGRSARGMINSMRNLSIGGALRKQKDVQDWEKQWDEDEDDESDEEEEEEEPAPLHVSAAAAASAVPVPLSPTRPAAQAVATSLSRGVAAPPSLAVSTATDLLSAPTPVTAPLSPTMHQQQAGPEWDTEGLPMISREAAGQRKPDVQMFLPMLRVLGKGSFGKVRFIIK